MVELAQSPAAVANPREQAVWTLLEAVQDPEIPVISIVDLGIVRGVSFAGELCVITITPTYSGCPAMDLIAHEIRTALADAGLSCRLETVLTPAWSTDWMTEKGRRSLAGYGIAPPQPRTIDSSQLTRARQAPKLTCPHCGSPATRLVSQFGSTACKALYRCDDCLEPFDHFKSH